MEPRQWTICPYCGGEMVIDGDCENCEIARMMQEEFDTWGQQLEREKMEDDDMSPEEAFHDTRRVDWEREVYRRVDEEDRLTRQDYDDLLDNLADWNDEPGEE